MLLVLVISIFCACDSSSKNNSPPYFYEKELNVLVLDGVSFVVMAKGDDVDGDRLSYFLSGKDSNVFVVDAAGLVSFKGQAKYYPPPDEFKNIYEFEVHVSDGDSFDVLALKVTVDLDTDRDGIPNADDNDDDGDGLEDDRDGFPIDPSWRMLLLPDWHSGEKYLFPNDPVNQARIAQDKNIVGQLVTFFGVDSVLMPGDLLEGEWFNQEFIAKFNPGGTAEETIRKAATTVYSSILDVFRQGGINKFIIAPGDHELGDNPWKPNSIKSDLVTVYREAFVENLNVYDINANVTGNIFGVSSTPIGTPYEGSSYAYFYKDTLIITLDVFEQSDPDVKSGKEGSVVGNVSGEHLSWLKDVLRAARQTAAVKHIIVQSHLPVMPLVKMFVSSGMTYEGYEESELWRIFKEYGVDFYFAGETHVNTAYKDIESKLIQVVGRGNGFNNFQLLDVSADKMQVLSFRQASSDFDVSKYYENGRVFVDRGAALSSGEFSFITKDKPIYYFSFDAVFKYEDSPINMIEYNESRYGYFNTEEKRNNIIARNEGEFGELYSLVTEKVGFEGGLFGSAAKFDPDSKAYSIGLGGLHENCPITYSVWLKTLSSQAHSLINTNKKDGNLLEDVFNLNIIDGHPVVEFSSSSKLLGTGKKLNDGEWHNLVVVKPAGRVTISSVNLYIDGGLLEKVQEGTDRIVSINPRFNISIGGGRLNAAGMASKPFVGLLDELSIWCKQIDGDTLSDYAMRIIH
jgi:hypothetical protein